MHLPASVSSTCETEAIALVLQPLFFFLFTLKARWVSDCLCLIAYRTQDRDAS